MRVLGMLLTAGADIQDDAWMLLFVIDNKTAATVWLPGWDLS